jgi:predicted nucleotidyltransferase
VVPEPIRVQVERCTAALVDVPGVRALSLGGSWATGDARPGSDVDIGVHYRTGEPLDIDACVAPRPPSTTVAGPSG